MCFYLFLLDSMAMEYVYMCYFIAKMLDWVAKKDVYSYFDVIWLLDIFYEYRPTLNKLCTTVKDDICLILY